MAIDGGDFAAVHRAVLELNTAATRLWRGARRGIGGEDVAVRKPQRLKAQEWLLATNNLLLKCAGKSWLHFRVAGGIEQPPLGTWPSITISSDQGSDAFAAANFLSYSMQCNVLYIADTSHRTWNDTKNALIQAGLWPLIVVGRIVLNVDGGPWCSQKWYQEAKETAATMIRLSTSDDSLVFQQFFHDIAVEDGLADRIGESDLPQTLFEQVPRCLDRILPQISLNRWFSWFDTMEILLQMWHKRLAIYATLCLEQGWTIEGDREGIVSGTVAFGGGADSRHQTNRESEEVRSLRRNCKNAMHLTTTLMFDREFESLCKGLCFLAHPVRKAHGIQNVENRSCPKVLLYMIAHTEGEGFGPLVETLGVLGSSNALGDCGLWSRADSMPPGLSLATLDSSHPFVVVQNHTCQLLGRFGLALVGHRLKSESWHLWGLPGRLPSLLSAKFLAPQSLVEWMRRVDAAWEVAVTLKDAFWKKVCRGSPLQLRFVQQVMHCCTSKKHIQSGLSSTGTPRLCHLILVGQ